MEKQKSVALLFDPPSTEFQESFCQNFGIEYKATCLFNRVFTFINAKCAKPASVLSIVGDVNCGFRALSVGLTGSRAFHGLIRNKIGKFLAEHIGENWCKLLMPNKETRRKHVKDVMTQAKDSSDVDSYARDIDFAAASKLFQVNVLIYSSVGWRVYSPDLENSWRKSKQQQELPSIQ
uniref:Uncharacterized protein n=1 Tax=Ditylenchus dipsaci TaxID=166011 RepID=A0A915DH85_9BILA